MMTEPGTPTPSSKVPVPKVIAASIGAAAATVACILFVAITGATVPVGLEGALATLFAFGAGYLKRSTP